jgi:hypothetical protein
MTDPHAIVDDLDRLTQELLQRAEKTKSDIAQVTGVATSEDGAATGALLGVTFGRAEKKPVVGKTPAGEVGYDKSLPPGEPPPTAGPAPQPVKQEIWQVKGDVG